MNAPLKAQLADSSDSRSEQELIAEALEAVSVQAQRDEFDLDPCMRAIELLESLPPTSEPVDATSGPGAADPRLLWQSARTYRSHIGR